MRDLPFLVPIQSRHSSGEDNKQDPSSDGTWQVFALTPVAKLVLPKPTRAFLLPVEGEPQEFFIPVGGALAQFALNNAVHGIATLFQTDREWDGRHGVFKLLTNYQAIAEETLPARNDVLGDSLFGPVLGPVIVVRLQCNQAGEDVDNDDPDSDFLSIPTDIKPADWKMLFN